MDQTSNHHYLSIHQLKNTPIMSHSSRENINPVRKTLYGKEHNPNLSRTRSQLEIIDRPICRKLSSPSPLFSARTTRNMEMRRRRQLLSVVGYLRRTRQCLFRWERQHSSSRKEVFQKMIFRQVST